jgi:ribosomal protein L11 methyltransferase
MHELALRVPADAVEDVLDRLLPLAPHGVHEIARDDHIELRLRGSRAELPSSRAVRRAAGAWGASLRERDVPDDWTARRLLDYEPLVIAGRLAIRPPWAPAPVSRDLIDLVLDDRDAFGAGTHPTTRACLEALCAHEPDGALADLGCGSGVLAIAAALLGWDPVVAVDYDPAVVVAASLNAAHNGVGIDVRETDLSAEPAPLAELVVANVPLPLHDSVATRMTDVPATLIASGVLASAADEAAAAYAAIGLREVDRVELAGWACLTLVG